MGCHSLLQGILQSQESKQGLLPFRPGKPKRTQRHPIPEGGAGLCSAQARSVSVTLTSLTDAVGQGTYQHQSPRWYSKAVSTREFEIEGNGWRKRPRKTLQPPYVSTALATATWFPATRVRNWCVSCRIPGKNRSAHIPDKNRSEERRVGKECRSRWSPDH